MERTPRPHLALALLGLLLAAFSAAAVLSAAPASSQSEAAAKRDVKRPKMSEDKISFGKERKRQMAGYSKRHYGKRTWKLERPKAVVLHWTAGSSWEGARNVFASNQPNGGERPGVCSHYIIEKSGRIHLIVSEKIRCRHTIGLNWTSVGIEFVQEPLGSSSATDRAILERRKQMRTGLRLVAYLRDRYDIRTQNVIGHKTANKSRYFKDRQGWRNDHTDWGGKAVAEFRRELRKKFG